MLDVRLRHRFPSAMIDIAFKADRGVTALFGPSGAGKSTVANAVAGLLRPDEGHVRLNGRLLSGEGMWIPPHRRRIGYVFQDARLFPHLSVRRNLLFGAPARMDIRAVVDLLGIGPLLDRHPAHLSGGERQRVAIGRALLSAPELLVLDEPLSALDPARKKEILPYLDRLTQEAGLPILYISHSVAEIVRLADQVVVLEAGRVAGMGPPASILADPQVSSHLGARVGGAMLQGKVTACAADGLITVRTEAGDLHLPDRFPVGAPVRLRIAAEDVILSVTEPVGLSALNMLNAKVTDLRPDGPMMTVVLRLPDGTPLLARITRRSSAVLDLRAGNAVFAILKTAAVMDQS